jgi:hypothetical protein
MGTDGDGSLAVGIAPEGAGVGVFGMGAGAVAVAGVDIVVLDVSAGLPAAMAEDSLEQPTTLTAITPRTSEARFCSFMGNNFMRKFK